MSVSTAGTVAEFDRARRAHSTTEGQPDERMSAPSVLRRDSVDPSGGYAVPFFDGSNGLTVVFPGEKPKPATPDAIASALNSPQFVAAPVDRAAVRAMVRMCAGAGADHAPTARLIEFAVRMPMSSKLLVLTDALARKYWIQAELDPAAVTDWRRAFNLPYDVRSLSWLAGRVFEESRMNGKQGVYRAELFKAEDAAVESVVKRGTAAAMAAYSASNSVSEMWGAYERVDTMLRYRYLVTGDVARATPTARVGGDIAVRLSTPFKVREGEVMVVSESDDQHLTRPAKLGGLGFDDGLIGVLSGPGKTGRGTKVSAMPMLDAALAAHDSVLITGAPFAGGVGFSSSVHRWATTAGAQEIAARPIARDVPLDVSLAGVPTVG